MKGVELKHAIHVLMTKNSNIREIDDLLGTVRTTGVEFLKLNCAKAAKKLSAINRPRQLAQYFKQTVNASAGN